jgi:hypothetical protein
LNAWVDLIQSSILDYSNDVSSYDEEMMVYEEKTKGDLQQVLLILENQIDELKDHEMDLLVDEEAPMQMLNLILNEHH